MRTNSLGTILLTLSVTWAGAQARPGESKPARTNAAAASSNLKPLNIKPGLWESTRTIKTAGAMPIPAELLNRLTPEQRARMEERMKARSAGHSNTTTEKHCVTKEDLEKDRLKLAEAKECTTTVLNSTSTSARAKLVCDTQGMHATGSLELLAADPEHLSGAYRSTVDGNGHTMNVEGTWTSKWVSASCGNTK